MTLAIPRRWWGYGVAGLLTVAAMVWVDTRDDDVAVVLPKSRTPGATMAQSAAAAKSGESAEALDSLSGRSINAPLADPFAAQPAAVGAAPAKSIETADSHKAVAASAAPPPLPFRFLGRWTEHGKTTVFLQRNDRSIAVRAPGRLDDEYAVQSIEEQGLVLKYLPLGRLQALRFDAQPDPPKPATVVAAPAAAETSDTPNEN